MPDGLGGVLSAWAEDDPPRAQRAEATLRGLLATRGQGVGVWDGSALTLPGCPWELAFSSGDPAWRYTVEPGPPQAPEARLDLAVDLLGGLGARRPEEALLQTLRSLQKGRPLRQGAHIGVRHGPEGDRFKLYVELPELSWRVAETTLAPWLRAPLSWHGEARNLRAALVGLGPGCQQIELYGGVDRLYGAELATLMAPSGLERRAPAVLALVRSCLTWPDGSLLPGPHWGFSHGLSPNGAPTFTVYTMARTLFGPDGASREALLGLTRRLGLDLGHYARLSAPLVGRRGFMGCHGMFGVVVANDAPLNIWIGLAPPGCAR